MAKAPKKPAAKAFDLADLDTVKACNAGAEIELKHPVTLAPVGIFVTVLGKDSDAFRGFMREVVDANLRQKAIGKKSKIKPARPAVNVNRCNCRCSGNIAAAAMKTMRPIAIQVICRYTSGVGGGLPFAAAR